MLRHIFMAPMLKEITDEQIDAMVEDFKTIDGKIPNMSNFHVGRNKGYFDKKMRFVMMADFPTKEDWENYMKNPVHLGVGEKYTEIFDKEHWIVTQTEY